MATRKYTPGRNQKTRDDGPYYYTRAYRCWVQIRDRCTNQRCQSYPDYGGRGIVMCERWQNFQTFLLDMGHPPKGLSLDRINNDGPYEPANCRWATKREQMNNTRRCIRLTFNGDTRTVSEWTRHLGWQRGVIIGRLKRRWPVDRALSIQPHTHCRFGHEFTPENTYVRPDIGTRMCRTCQRRRESVRP